MADSTAKVTSLSERNAVKARKGEAVTSSSATPLASAGAGAPKHSYGKVDMSDEQIVGGGKDRTLIKYSPGIVISEKGQAQDKKDDEHHE